MCRHSTKLVGEHNGNHLMKKAEFLRRPQTVGFVEWLASVIDGSEPIAFAHHGGVDQQLSDPLARYEWPPRTVNVDTPAGPLTLAARADFAANELVLDRLSVGIRGALKGTAANEPELVHWAQAIMKWGGVLTRKGNAGWLQSMRKGSFSGYLTRAMEALKGDDDTTHCGMSDLRSNAGTTKIHSLLLPHFVIYDSRVAAALAWLVHRWAKRTEVTVAEYLRFACMPANTSKIGGKVRSPDPHMFPVFSPTGHVRSHHRHAMWNLRANWVIQAAIELGAEHRFHWSPRKVEAALFMMGDDLVRAV